MMKNVLSFFVFASAFLTSAIALAEEGGGTSGTLMPIGLAIAIGMAALGGTLAQGRATASALEGIARNPGASGQMFVPMMLGLAFIESLVLLTFVLILIKLN